MLIYAISGSGIGAGKSTLAKSLQCETWSLAGPLRKELSRMYPRYNWFNKEQAYKENTIIKEAWDEYGDARPPNMRTVLIKHGQKRAAEDAKYWVRILATSLAGYAELATGPKYIAIDDVRKVCEIEHLRDRFGENVLHIHIKSDAAIHESEFEAAGLEEAANYIMTWRP